MAESCAALSFIAGGYQAEFVESIPVQKSCIHASVAVFLEWCIVLSVHGYLL